MSVAVLIQSEGSSLDSKRRQALIVPVDFGARLFTRVTDGGKGKGNAWSEASDVDFHADEYLTHEPVGVVLTASDEDALRTKGSVSVLAQKALTALSKMDVLNSTPGADHPRDVLDKVVEQVTEQSAEVAEYVRDGRRVNPITMTRPAIRPVPVPQAVAVAAPAAARQPAPAASFGCALTVADPAFAKKYVNRKVRGKSDFDIFKAAQANDLNVQIMGPTGSGKTTGAVAYASATGQPYFRVPGNQALVPEQLYGSYVPDGVGGFVWQDGPVTAIVRQGGVLILDEANLISPKVLTDLYPLLDFGREITLKDHGNEVVKAKSGTVLIVVTGNPDYVGTGLFSEAFKDRFAVRFLDWGYDAAVERKLVKSRTLLKMANDLRARKDDILTPVSTRLLTEFEEVVNLFGWDFAVENLLDRFDDSEEREAVRGVFNTSSDGIKIDLGLKEKPVVETPEVVDDSPALADWERDLLSAKAPWDN
jgi:nitric oxide reductase NorQ protein